MEVIIRKKSEIVCLQNYLWKMSNHDHRIRNVSDIVQGKPYNKLQKIIHKRFYVERQVELFSNLTIY
jgi:hypothetical protein